MMTSFSDILDKALSWLLLPATACGAFGAFFRCRRSGKSALQTATEVIGGAVVANVTMPIVADYTPAIAHWTIFFLVGWGGMSLVELAYQAFAKGIEARIRRIMGLGGIEGLAPSEKPEKPEKPEKEVWDGVERRKNSR